jgi:glycosyltransferase involved in cell wall biosynthesis
MIVNQWVPAAHRGDAVGDGIIVMRDLFRAWGHESEIYALSIDRDLRDEVRPWTGANVRQGDVTIYHYAVPSEMTPAFRTLPGARVLQYHNVTPAHFFADYDTGIFRVTSIGRRELGTLADATDLGLGDSEYNRQELEQLGFRHTDVLPVFVNTARLTGAPSVPVLEHVLQDGFANILFVGRIAPNKKIEDHLRMAEMYKRYSDSRYRFIFVGRSDAVPRYFAAIQALVTEYQMLPERFWFTGSVPDAELAAYYRHAHAYVSLSEHEGFCVPLVESMAMDVPILAYGAGAVPETLGGAGVCFTPKDLEYAAEMLAAIVYDESLRRQLIAGQRARLADFDGRRLEARLRSVLAAVA